MSKPPPTKYAEENEMREWGRFWSDRFMDKGVVQEALGWFQCLIASGRIWLFDVLGDEIDFVDEGTNWA
jgi:hypothetical protein